MQERIGGQHPLRREKEKGGVDEADDNCNLKKIEKDLELYTCASVVLRKKEHHQDRGAVQAVEQAPGRIRQDGLVEQGVVGLEGGGNEQDNLDGGEQKPEQGSNALRATECIPGASECEKANKNENGFG